MERTQTAGNKSSSTSQPLPQQREFSVHLNGTKLSLLSSISYLCVWLEILLLENQ